MPIDIHEKVDTESINSYVSQMQEDGKTVSAAYPEIDIIREVDYLKEKIQKIQILINYQSIWNFRT